MCILQYFYMSIFIFGMDINMVIEWILSGICDVFKSASSTSLHLNLFQICITLWGVNLICTINTYNRVG